MLDLHKRLPAAKTPQERTALERQISATDNQIDKLVYDLYSLTEDEIKLVEGKSVTTEASDPVSEDPLSGPMPRKPKTKKGKFADSPASPPAPGTTPEQAYGDAAHYYSAKEEGPEYEPGQS
jgi:hypothetical protein